MKYSDILMSRRTTTIRIDDALLEGLQIMKDRDGVPISEQVRRAIQAWLESRGVSLKPERKRAATRKRP